MDVDGDDEDEEALRSLMSTQTGSSGAVEEAKVRCLIAAEAFPNAPFPIRFHLYRVLNAQNAARYSRPRP
jgi:hypothetical protein